MSLDAVLAEVGLVVDALRSGLDSEVAAQELERVIWEARRDG